MKYTICTAPSRTSTHWAQEAISWPDFIERCREPRRGRETHAEYMAMSKDKQAAIKDVGGFVAGRLVGERRKRGCCTGRSMITLDMDNCAPDSTDQWVEELRFCGMPLLIYSTYKHDRQHPRLRVVIPTDREMTVEEYGAVARAVAVMIDPTLAVFDKTTFEPERLMYWPACSKDSEPVFYGSTEGCTLSVDEVLSLNYQDWHNIAEWPLCPGESPTESRSGRQADPCAKQGLVGAFCREYSVSRAIYEFLPETYTEAAPGRYTYTLGSTTGGAVLYDDDKFLYSHHSTDPAGGRLVNAWDLVRIHLFGALDSEAKPDTPTNRLPSYAKMTEWVNDNLPEIAARVTAERVSEAIDGFEPVPEGKDWRLLLARSQKGEILSTAQNMLLILTHDPVLAGRIWDDSFSNRRKCRGPLPWDSLSEDSGTGEDCDTDEERGWSDSDDAGLRWYFETAYHLTGASKVRDSACLIAAKNARDPVAEYLSGLTWDGTPRLDTVFTDYLGAEDNDYTRAVARKCLVAAVARVFQPGYKYDQVVIFSGPQGAGKSSFLAKLGQKWFSDSIASFQGKDARESLRGVWIIELGELTAMDKSESEAVKQFISQTEDWYRPSYGVNAQQFPRRCVFFGTSNKSDFLRDSTGNRRFWPIDVYRFRPKYDIREMGRDSWLDDDTVAQIWAEAVMRYREGEPTWIKGDQEALALLEQEKHQEVDQWYPIIREFVSRPIPRDWSQWNADQREAWWAENYADADQVETTTRHKVCIAEIWCELLHNSMNRIDLRDQRRIGSCLDMLPGWSRGSTARNGFYGIQRSWVKDDEE